MWCSVEPNSNIHTNYNYRKKVTNKKELRLRETGRIKHLAVGVATSKQRSGTASSYNGYNGYAWG